VISKVTKRTVVHPEKDLITHTQGKEWFVQQMGWLSVIIVTNLI
jgi:hypothetical protein